MCVLRSFIPGQQKKTARPRMFRHFVPSRELHSLATLVRLSLVDLPSANSMKCCSPPASLISINLEEFMIKRMMMALCIFVCTFTLVACSGQQTNEPLTFKGWKLRRNGEPALQKRMGIFLRLISMRLWVWLQILRNRCYRTQTQYDR